MSNSVIWDTITAKQYDAISSFDLTRYVWINNQPVNTRLASCIQTLDVNYSMDQVSQITVNMDDPNLTFSRAGWFNLRTPMQFFLSQFEISTLEFTQGAAVDEHVILGCRPLGAQRLKRSKGELIRANISPTNFMQLEAQSAGMKFVGEPSANVAQIARTASATTDESSWDVGTTLAGNVGYIMFESDNTLYFGKPTWLVGQAGHQIVIHWPPLPTDVVQLLNIPDCRISDDDENGVSMTLNLQRDGKARLIRPGMTIQVGGIPPFSSDILLINSVTWTEYDTGAVVVEAKSPVDPVIPSVSPSASNSTTSSGGKGETVLNLVSQSGVDSQNTANQILDGP